MPITHPFILTQYQNALGAGQALLMTQGAQTPINFTPQVRGQAGFDNYVRSSFSWGGNIYLPMGNIQSNSFGWFSYNQETGEFDIAMMGSHTRKYIPFGKYIAHIISSTATQRGTHPFNTDISSQAPVGLGGEDHLAFGNNLFILGNSISRLNVWGYPFTSAPAGIATGVNMTRLVVFKNNVYAFNISTGTSYLWKWQGGSSWAQVGSGFTLPEAASVSSLPSTCSTFEFNGKLWLLVKYSSAGTKKVRIFEVDESLGTVTDRSTTHNPTAWNSSATFNLDHIFEIIDDLGPSRQVYVIHVNQRTLGGWELIDFQDGANTIDSGNSGGHDIWPYCGVIWNSAAKGAHIKSAVDSSPSSRVEMQIAVSDLVNQGNVSIDPRYNDVSLTTEVPPFNQCTELQGEGSEGKTGLSSKPAGITTLANLSDDFGDASIDDDLWQVVFPSLAVASYDRGHIYQLNKPELEIEEIAGPPQSYLKLGGTSPTPAIQASSGIGVMGKWFIDGAFQIDVKLHNLANLTLNAGRSLRLFLFIKEATNRGAFISIFRTGAGAGGLFARAGYAQDDSNIVDGPDSTANPVDGDIIRLIRNGSDVWSAILDPLGDNEDINPGIPNLSGKVKIWLFAHSETTANWASIDDAPGFYDLAVSGAGALGKYDGELEHEFHWDHLGDLGAGINKAFELHVDTE